MEKNRKQQIEEALLDCMSQMTFDRITVAELCRRADVSRRVFYYHYPNTEACLQGVFVRVLTGCSLYVSESSTSGDTPKVLYHHFLEYWVRQGSFLRCIASGGCYSAFANQIVAYISSEEKHLVRLLEQGERAYIAEKLRFYAGGVMDLIVRWAVKDFDIPIDEMETLLMELLQTPF